MKREKIYEYLPEGYKEACWETKAMSRKTGLQNENDLLTLCMFYGYDHSLIEVISYAKAQGIYNISDVGFMKRFSRCTEWFKWMIDHIKPTPIVKYESTPKLKERRLLAVDASDIIGGGKQRLCWHLHYAVDLFNLSSAGFKITSEKTGETLKNFEFRKEDIILGDRAYASISGIEYCQNSGADFILRIKNNAFNLYTEDEEKKKLSEMVTFTFQYKIPLFHPQGSY